MPGGCVRGAGAEDEPVCAVTGLVCPEKMKYSTATMSARAARAMIFPYFLKLKFILSAVFVRL